MVDVHDKKTRRKNMQAIKTENTFIEKTLSSLLEQMNLEYQVQIKELPGKPDFVIDEYKAIIFTHGCFWHKHDCYLFKLPKTRTEFWLNKIESNHNRDIRDIDLLLEAGWRVLIIWECALRGKRKLSIDSLCERLEEWLCAGYIYSAIDTMGIHQITKE